MLNNLTSSETVIVNRLSNGSGKKRYRDFYLSLKESNDIDFTELDDAINSLINKGLVCVTESGRGPHKKRGFIWLDPGVRDEILVRKRPDHIVCWLDSLTRLFPECTPERILPLVSKLPALCETEIVALVKCLKNYVEHHDEAQKLTDRIASARYFLGSAKVLERLKPLACALVDTKSDKSPSTMCVLVNSPATPTSFTLVENKDSWLLASRLCPESAWCCCNGFSLSSITHENLDDILMYTQAGTITPSLRDLFRHRNLFFWGDLDPAGMQIFRALRTNFPGIRLSPLYKPAIERLKSDDISYSHGFHALSDKANQKIDITVEDPLAQRIVDICKLKGRGVDQEALGNDEIVKYGSMLQPLDCLIE